MEQVRRLSGAGVLNCDTAFARALLPKQADAAVVGSVANSYQDSAEERGSGGEAAAVPMKRTASSLARDKSGRFIGKGTPAAKKDAGPRNSMDSFRRGSIDPNDPLEQDLMVSQAHLFDDALTMRRPVDSPKQQVGCGNFIWCDVCL